MMKILLITIVCLHLVSTLLSQGFMPGDTLIVASLNGINLRESGSVNGLKTGVLSNGEKVIILPEAKLIEDSLDGFNGTWVRVATVSNKQQEGYVFDAYLSRFSI